MTNKEWLKHVEEVSDPIAALRLLLSNEHYLGYDPYYKDMREALLRMCARCIAIGRSTTF